jgi:hypothetical protein
MLGNRALSAVLLLLPLSSFAFGGPHSSTIQGITREPAGQPLAQAQVTVHSEQNGDRTVVSSNEGSFVIEDLAPGRYQVTATKAGFKSLGAIPVDLAAHQSLRVDVTLASLNDSKGATGPAPSPVVTDSSDRAPLTAREKQLLERVNQLEQRLAALEAKEDSQRPTGATATPAPEPSLASLNPTAAFPPAKVLTPTLPQGPAQEPAKQHPANTTATPAAPVTPALQEALQAPESAPTPSSDNVYTWADYTWLNGTPRNKDTVLDTKFFTPEVRFDTHFMEDFNQPRDHTMGGATESFRSGEIQVEQISVGGDFHWQNVRGRILTMNGLFATTTPRNDASAGVGQWDVRGAYKYVSEAYGGYHFNVNHGLNVDAGIFVSYIGLFSYYNFDNWIYQPSYVSSNTPWFFNGVRIQWFPTAKLKIEPWIINGWQSYNRYNGHIGLGGQILYRPKQWLSLVFNQYGYGQDNLGLPHTQRIHTDDSIEVKYYDNEGGPGINKMAFSLTADLGCQYGGGFRCTSGATKDSFAGWMGYNRIWFGNNKYAVSFGGGRMNNPGRYLTLLPPIDGADAVSGTPYFTENPGQPAHMWDSSIGLQWMPKQYVTWWIETGYRHSDVPYWTGRGGITPPGGNNGLPQYYACNSGASAMTADPNAAQTFCTGQGGVWFPDLRRGQATLSAGIMVKF